MIRPVLVAAALAAGFAGCGGAERRAEVRVEELAAPPKAAPEPEPPPEIEIQGELGTLEPAQVETAFRGATPKMHACFQTALARTWYLGGAVELKVRVGPDGAVKSAAVLQPLGDWETERCLVGVVGAVRFPPPRGGPEAEFNYPLSFRGKATLREWGRAEVGAALAAHRAAIDACARKGSAPPSPRVTFFVLPGGQVGAAGLGADGPIEETWGRCVVQALARMKFDDPRGRIARATADL